VDPVVKVSETGQVAVQTALAAPRTWFVFDTANGGRYTPGDREGLNSPPPEGDVNPAMVWTNMVRQT
jgi:hypothetical protein